jgi:hypothetical protein
MILKRELFARYKRDYQHTIRIKVLNLLRHWIEDYYSEDFGDNTNDLLTQLQEFIKIIPNERHQQIVMRVLNKKMTNYEYEQQQKQNQQQQDQSQHLNESLFSTGLFESNELSTVFDKTSIATPNSSRSSSTSTAELSSSEMSTTSGSSSLSMLTRNQTIVNFPPITKHLEDAHGFDILSVHPYEFARQITLIESEYFRAIKPSELISFGWNIPEKKHLLSPNICKLSYFSNCLTYWYAKCVVVTLNLEERVAVVKRILEISEYLYEMNNFSGLKEIYAALGTSSVNRLKVTLGQVGHNKMYEKMKQLFDGHDKGYLDRLKSCQPPCVPFIGIHLSILLKKKEYNKMYKEKQSSQIVQQQLEQRQYLNEMNGGKIDENLEIKSENLINFSKYRQLVEIVSDVLQYKTDYYKYRVYDRFRQFLIEDIKQFFEKAKKWTEEEKKREEKEKMLDLTTLKSSDSFLTKFDSISIESTQLSVTQMVESWLFDKSKTIENNKGVDPFPKLKKYYFETPSMIVNKKNHSKITPNLYDSTNSINEKSIISHSSAKNPLSTVTSLVRSASSQRAPKIAEHKRSNSSIVAPVSYNDSSNSHLAQTPTAQLSAMFNSKQQQSESTNNNKNVSASVASALNKKSDLSTNFNIF